MHSLIEFAIAKTPFDEDLYVKKYMLKYGINNVRGGSYSRTILSKHEIKILARELCTASNTCYACKKSGHSAKDCIQRYS